MTFEHYLNQPKNMLEWKLNAIFAINLQLEKYTQTVLIH